MSFQFFFLKIHNNNTITIPTDDDFNDAKMKLYFQKNEFKKSLSSHELTHF